jgi:hypothetical protein
MKRKTYKDWDKPIPAGFPVGLVMHPSGANRRQRRASRDHKNDPMPPNSMVPHVKRVKYKEEQVFSKHEPMKTIKVVDGVEYVAER